VRVKAYRGFESHPLRHFFWTIMDWLIDFPSANRATLLDIRHSIDSAFKDFTAVYGESFETFFYPVLQFLIWTEKLLLSIPWSIFFILLTVISWSVSRNWKLVLFIMVSFLAIGYLGMWEYTMQTISLVIVSTTLCIIVGVPFGVLCGKKDIVRNISDPILDTMIAIPTFVYLIPVVMLLGVGKVPGLLAVVIYSIPPTIRLTNLGIRLVDKGLVESAQSLGLSKFQTLWTIEMPMAVPNIFAGINQTIMMSLGMVVIAAMIGAPGLGIQVLKAISNQYLSLGLFYGSAIVVLAITLDRILSGYSKKLTKWQKYNK
jgi:glycine betaine/proline transport system permease protein